MQRKGRNWRFCALLIRPPCRTVRAYFYPQPRANPAICCNFFPQIKSHTRVHSMPVCILLCPAQGTLSDDAVWRLSDVCRVHPVGGRRVRPAGWMARIGWSGPARPAWLKAATARFRCRPGWGHIVAAARLQLVYVVKRLHQKPCLLGVFTAWCLSADVNKTPRLINSAELPCTRSIPTPATLQRQLRGLPELHGPKPVSNRIRGYPAYSNPEQPQYGQPSVTSPPYIL